MKQSLLESSTWPVHGCGGQTELLPIPRRSHKLAGERPSTVPPILQATAAFLLFLTVAASSKAQTPTESSSTPTPSRTIQNSSSTPTPRIAQPEAAGSAITLETSEPLFQLAVALNTCGYDAGLADSHPVRLHIRDEVNAAIAESEPARDARDKLCAYIRDHTLADPGLNLAQYVSLALYVKPYPDLTPSVDETELPPDSTQVVNILPLLSSFSDTVHLHALWVNHRSEYEALVNAVHDPLTRMILGTNIYLHQPASSYDGRRFLVLLEPMLAPGSPNARIYANDFIIVTSPSNAQPATVKMDEIRHTYLHYEVEPLVYARAAAMDRLLPLLKPVQNAPLDFAHKSDIVALLTECLIKAIEARTLDTGLPEPKRPEAIRVRAVMEKYDADKVAFDRQAEVLRRKLVDQAMRQGWVITEYFYNQLGLMEKDGVSLKDNIGEMVYGMDVQRERHHDEQIVFLPEGTNDVAHRVPQKLSGLRLAEMDLLKGDTAAASELAEKALTDPAADHAEANYVLARAELMERQPEEAIDHFNTALKTSKNPRTLAWSHIYLGRLYDIQSERPKAVEQYRAALATRDSQLDTKAAAETGLKQPFALPARARQHDEDDTPIDPSGKAEKEAYRPTPTVPATPQP